MLFSLSSTSTSYVTTPASFVARASETEPQILAHMDLQAQGSVPDLRDCKCGGWSMARLNVKWNGRWGYIFPPSATTPVNTKEPIGLDKGYRPPNFRRSLDLTATIQDHPLRASYFQNGLKQRAPLSRSTLQIHGKIEPPVWKNVGRKTQDIRTKTALMSRIAKKRQEPVLLAPLPDAPGKEPNANGKMFEFECNDL